MKPSKEQMARLDTVGCLTFKSLIKFANWPNFLIICHYWLKTIAMSCNEGVYLIQIIKLLGFGKVEKLNVVIFLPPFSISYEINDHLK